MPENQPRTVICNTSPMFYLHRIGQIACLPALYNKIILPESVRAELAVYDHREHDAQIAIKRSLQDRTAQFPGIAQDSATGLQ